MKIIKRFKKTFISIFSALVLLCTGLLAINLKREETANAYNTIPAGTIDNLWNGTKFEGNTLDQFAKKVGYDGIVELVDDINGGEIKKASQMGTNTTLNFGSYTFGGIEREITWIPTYLSKDNNGNVILTLWLASTDSKNGTLSNQEITTWSDGTYKFEYNSSSTQSYTDSNYDSPTTRAVYANTYDGSYIRNVMILGRGANSYTKAWGFQWSDSKNSAVTISGSPATIPTQATKFTQFVSGDFAKYLVAPENVDWLQSQSDMNDISYTGNYNANFTSAWKKDLVWLPSYNEIKSSGIWDCSIDQIKNNAWSPTRTATLNYSSEIRYFGNDGEEILHAVSKISAVRPAINLNLTEVLKNYEYTINDPQDATSTYSGSKHNISDFSDTSWYKAEFLDSTKITSTIYLKNQQVTEMKDAGEYWIKFQITDTWKNDIISKDSTIRFKGTANTYDSNHSESDTVRWAKFTINKKKIAVNLTEGSDGFLIASAKNPLDIIADDLNTARAPVFGVTYSNSNYTFDETTTPTKPNKVGTYLASAKIINDCNYEIDTSQAYTRQFVKNKTLITRPSIADPKKVYNSFNQDFALNGGMAYSDIRVIPITDGLSYNGTNGTLSAKNAGIYQARVSLTDAEQTEWRTGTNKAEDFIIEIEITKKPLTLTFASADNWIWKADQTPTITITGDSYTNDQTRLYIYYYNSNNPSVKFDDINKNKVLSSDGKTRTITMPKLEPGTYAIGVTIFGSEDQNDNYYIVREGGIASQPFTVQGSAITLTAPKWQYNGIEITNTTNLKFTYTGSSFNFSVDEDDLAANGMEIDTTNSNSKNGYSGDISAINFGTSYSVTVYLKSLPNYEQTTLQFTLDYEISRARYDLSGLSWNYSESRKIYFKKGTEQGVTLAGTIPNGLTALYTGNGRIAVGSYTTSVSFNNSNNNYISPIYSDSSTYIGDFDWTCNWRIDKAILSANWDMTSNVPKLRPINDISLHDLVNYTYYETDEAGNKLGEAITADQIGKDSTKEQFYIVEANLKPANTANYELDPTVPSQRFSVGSNKYVIQLYVTFNGEALKATYSYTGTPFVVDVVFSLNPSGLEASDIVITYYKDGSSTGSTTVPTEVGSYHAVITVRGEINNSVIEDNFDEFDFEIEKANFDVSGLKWQYTHGDTVATYDFVQNKWIDSENNEVTNLVFDGREHIIELVGQDTLPSSLSATIVGENATVREGKIVFTNAGTHNISVTFNYDEDCYNAPNFASSLPFTLAKAKIDTSNMEWGYIVNNNDKEEFSYTGPLQYTRVGDKTQSLAVEYTLKLINVPAELASCIKYSGDYIQSRVGTYRATYEIDSTLFNSTNFEDLTIPSGLRTNFTWKIETKYLDNPVYNGSWTIFDDEIHSFIEMCGIQNDWYLYYDIVITKDDQPYGGLVGDEYVNVEDKEYKAKDAGVYKLSFTLKNANSDFIWKEWIQDITIEVKKISVDIERWARAGISAEIVSSATDYEFYIDYRYKDNDGNPVTADFIMVTPFTKFVKEVFVKDEYLSNVELIGETEHHFETAEEGITIAQKPIASNNIIYTGEDIDVSGFLIDFKPLIMEITEGGIGREIGTYTAKIRLTSPAYRWADEDASVNEIEVTWRILEKELEVLSKPTFADIFYTGEEIDIVADNLIIGFDSTKMEIVEGSVTKGTTVGTYTIKIRLIDKNYTFGIISALAEEIVAESEYEEIELTWEIKKARIVGSWDTSGKYPIFVPQNSADADKFTTKYISSSGNEVAPADMIEGETYTAQLILNDAENYEFVSTNNSQIESFKEFKYGSNGGLFGGNLIMIMLFILLILFIIIIILLLILIFRKKKKDEKQPDSKDPKADDKNQNNYNELQEQKLKELETIVLGLANGKVNKTTLSNISSNSHDAEQDKKLEALEEKIASLSGESNSDVTSHDEVQDKKLKELEAKLDRMTSKDSDKNSLSISSHDDEQDKKLKELEEQISKLTTSIAFFSKSGIESSTYDEIQDKKLANLEKQLAQLSNNSRSDDVSRYDKNQDEKIKAMEKLISENRNAILKNRKDFEDRHMQSEFNAEIREAQRKLDILEKKINSKAGDKK